MSRRTRKSDSRLLTDDLPPKRFSTLSMVGVMLLVLLLVAVVVCALMVWLIAQEGWPP